MSPADPNDPPLPLSALRGGARLGSVVYDLLKERLLEGRYAGNEQLPVEALRTEWGVSKQPVMEALRRLSADGLVTIIPQVGCRVATYRPLEVEDFFLMFGSIEGAIAGVAATRRDAAQLRELDQISATIGELRGETDAETRSHGYRLLNRRFHTAIHTMARSRVMADTSARMWDLSDFLINTAGGPRPLSRALDARHDDHERIRSALHAGDRLTARQEMEEHIVGIVKDVIQPARQPSG